MEHDLTRTEDGSTTCSRCRLSKSIGSAWTEPCTGTCTDCGGSPIWKHGDGLCRRCFVKGGNKDYVEVDIDKLELLLGEELAGRVMAECLRSW